MIRILGAVLMILSTTAMGYGGVRRLRERVRNLEGIIASLDVMESEICSHLTPMREVLEMLSRNAPVQSRRLFENVADGMCALGRCSFYSIWREGVETTKELLLKPEEAETLVELGLCLGRYDVREQAEMISRVRRRLEIFLKRAEEERERDTKMHAFFGISAGIFAVIILI